MFAPKFRLKRDIQVRGTQVLDSQEVTIQGYPARPERTVTANKGDWVVEHPNGLLSVWTNEEFNAAYEAVKDE